MKSECKVCTNNRNKAYAKKNPEKIRAAKRAWKAENRESVLAGKRDWYDRYREDIAERRRVARLANPAIRARERMVYVEQKGAYADRQRVAYKMFPERFSANRSARRARLRGAPGSHTAEQIIDLMKKQRGRCACCGVGIEGGYHKDHITSLSRGGSEDITNIQLLCGPCNLSKHAKDPIDFMQERGFLL